MEGVNKKTTAKNRIVVLEIFFNEIYLFIFLLTWTPGFQVVILFHFLKLGFRNLHLETRFPSDWLSSEDFIDNPLAISDVYISIAVHITAGLVRWVGISIQNYIDAGLDVGDID